MLDGKHDHFRAIEVIEHNVWETRKDQAAHLAKDPSVPLWMFTQLTDRHVDRAEEVHLQARRPIAIPGHCLADLVGNLGPKTDQEAQLFDSIRLLS